MTNFRNKHISNQIIYLTIFIIGAAFALLVIQSLRNSYSTTTMAHAESQAKDLLSFENEYLLDLGESVYKDLYYLSLNTDFTQYIEEMPVDKEELIEVFSEFSLPHIEYGQVRYLNEFGIEVVRITHNSDGVVIVPDPQLQDKSERYYFLETKSLDKGGMYVSPLDFNIENGYVDYLDPVVRFATPIYNAKDEFKGIIVLNYNASFIFDGLAHNVEHNTFPIQIGMINVDNYWISVPETDSKFEYISSSSSEYGFLFEQFVQQTTMVNEGKTYISSHIGTETNYPLTIAEENKMMFLVASYTTEDAFLANHSPYYMETNIAVTLILLSGFLLMIIVRVLINLINSASNLKITEFISSHSTEGILVTDSTMKTTYMNEPFTRYFGYTPEQMIGNDPTEIMPAPYRLIHKAVDSMISGHVWNITERGNYILVHASFMKIIGLAKQITNYVALYQKPDTFKFDVNDLNVEIASKFRFVIIDFFLSLLESLKDYKHLKAILIDVEDYRSFDHSHTEKDAIKQTRTVVNNLRNTLNVLEIAILSDKTFVLFVDDARKNHVIEQQLQTILRKENEHQSHIIITQTLMNNHEDDIVRLFIKLELAKSKSTGIKYEATDEIKDFIRITELNHILEGDLSKVGFEIHYQTQRETNTSKIVGMEALSRLQLKDFGYIPPLEFISLLENSNRTRDFAIYLISQILEDIKNYDIPKHITISMNLSVKDLNEGFIKDELLPLINRSNIDPNRVAFEMTESTMIDNVETTNAIIDIFKQQNHKVFLDDFGTGYSSLGYLEQLKFDSIKIDKQFIKNTKKDSVSLLETVVLICNKLNATTIIEGVETIEQLELVKKFKIDHYQGYLDSYPKPIQELFDKKRDK